LSGNYKKALNAYQKVMELTPDSDIALMAKEEAKKLKF